MTKLTDDILNCPLSYDDAYGVIKHWQRILKKQIAKKEARDR